VAYQPLILLGDILLAEDLEDGLLPLKGDGRQPQVVLLLVDSAEVELEDILAHLVEME
jgi:hypothetical protein